MLAMLIYVLVLGVLLSVAALIAEQAATQRGASRRWIWLCAIIASIVLPLAMASVSIQFPASIKPYGMAKSVALRDATTIRMPAAVAGLSMPMIDSGPHRFDVLFQRLSAGVSLTMLAALMLSGGLLYRRKRRWAESTLDGRPVLIAPDVGPAVVGLLHPRIVVPAWLLQEPAERRQCVLAHEQAHLDARDPQLLTVALCMLVAMPWNLSLWWQLHRLRRALEVDCDARVLRSGRDLGEYCETLIQVGQNQSRYIGAVAAMSEPGSLLEQRIKIMLRKPGKWARLSALALVCAAVGVTAFAAQLTPPDSTSEQQVKVSPAVLAAYAGYYQAAPYVVLSVQTDGTQLVLESAKTPVPFAPLSDHEFFSKLANMRVSFERDAQGHATAAVLHKNGHDTSAPRIDTAQADTIKRALQARVSAQQPFPGSEQALQVVLSEDPASARLSPAMAQAMRQQKPGFAASIGPLGAVVSHEFTGVNLQGWDKYLVRHEHGTEEVSFVLDAHGTIVGAFRQR